MIRKILTTVMCLLLALALPLTSLAATEYTVTATLGDELGSVAGIKDLMDALSLKLLLGEQSGMLTLNISGTDVLSLAAKADENGVYVQSGAIGEKPLYFSKEDVIDGAVSFLQSSQSMDEEQIAAMKASMEQMFDGVGMLSSLPQTAADEKAEAADMTFEESVAAAKEQIQSAFGNDPVMVDYLNGVLDSMVVTDGDYTDAAHDPATQMITLTITGADIAKLADSKQMENTFSAQAKADGMTVEEAKAQFIDTLNKCEMNIPITIYTADESKSIVSMVMNMTMKGTATVTKTEDGKTETETEDIDVAMDMAYNRLNADGMVNHSCTMQMIDEGEKKADGTLTVTDDYKGTYQLDGVMTVLDDGKEESAVTAKGELNVADETQFSGWLAILGGTDQITFDFSGKATEQGKEKTIAVYARQDAAAIVAPAASDRPMITLTIATNGQATEEALAAVNSADVAGSDQVLHMSEDELKTWLTAVQANAMQALYAAMAVLPASTMEMFVGSSSTTTQQ